MNRRAYVKFIALILVLIATIGIATGYEPLQPESLPLEVEEPLQILEWPTELSLCPGETLQFSVDVENHASVGYSASLVFWLDDAWYQEEYVSFSQLVYAINPGINNLTAWLTVSNLAPPAHLKLSIGITRNIGDSAEPSLPAGSFTPSAVLFGAGARWASPDGSSALYINWLDNYYAHNETGWGPYWGESYMAAIRNTTIAALTREGFIVTCVADVPEDLSGYDLVVFEAYYAVEPKHASLVRDYLKRGGSVIVTGGVPCYFSTYCKDMWPYVTGGQDLTALQDWFGASYYVNSGGLAKLNVDAPFGTSLSTQAKFYYIDAYGAAGVIGLSNSTQALATWQDGIVFAFTNEYGNARVYYQVAVDW